MILEKRVLNSQENKSCFHPPGSFLLTNSQLSPRSGYVSRLIGPTLPGNMKYCLRFYFALRGEGHTALDWLPRHFFNSLCLLLFESMCESFAVIYFSDSLIRNNSGNCRFQPDRPGSGCISATAAAEQHPGEDLDSGREIKRNLDRDGCHLPNITACQGQKTGSANITSPNLKDH